MRQDAYISIKLKPNVSKNLFSKGFGKEREKEPFIKRFFSQKGFPRKKVFLAKNQTTTHRRNHEKTKGSRVKLYKREQGGGASAYVAAL